jgi:hypothetical protein
MFNLPCPENAEAVGFDVISPITSGLVGTVKNGGDFVIGSKVVGFAFDRQIAVGMLRRWVVSFDLSHESTAFS